MSNLFVDVTGNTISGLPPNGYYGMAIARANRRVSYSSLDVTWNQVDFFEVAGGDSAYRVYDVLIDRETLGVQMLIDPPPLNRRAVAHNISIIGSQVFVSGGSERAFILVLMR